MRLGIESRIVLLVEIAVLSIVVFSGVTTYIVINRVFEQQTLSHLESIAFLKEDTIKTYLGQARTEIENINQSTRMKIYLTDLLGKGGLNRAAISTKIIELTSYKDIFSEVMVLDRSGKIVFSTKSADEGMDKSNEPYFYQSKEETFMQDYFIDDITGLPAIAVGTPIRSSRGEFLGVLAGKIKVDKISDLLLDRTGLGNTDETFLVNSSKLVVTDLLKEPGAVFKRTINLPQINYCLTGQSRNQKVMDYHGEWVLGYYLWFPELRSCLVSKIDYTEAVAPIVVAIRILLVVYVSGGLILGLLGLLQAGAIVRPLKKLRDMMTRIEGGDFGARIDIESNDEIGDMAKSINEMAKQLEVSYGGLEEKVKEKTADLEEKVTELEKINKLMVNRELRMIKLKEQIERYRNEPTGERRKG